MATRADTMMETRTKLIAAGRKAFAAKGYAATALEDLTSKIGLTRGALYHHFDGKKGLLEAVIVEIDAEMMERASATGARARTKWQAFINEMASYIEMATEPEIQRIMLLDGPAVLGDVSRWPSQTACVRTTKENLEILMREGAIRKVDSDAMARLVSGAALNASLWIANSDNPKAASAAAVKSFVLLLSGLLK